MWQRSAWDPKPVDVSLHPIWHAGGEFLDAVVVPVGCKYGAIRSNGKPENPVELPRMVAPTAADGGQIGTGIVEDLNAVVAAVGHVEPVLSVHRQPIRSPPIEATEITPGSPVRPIVRTY